MTAIASSGRLDLETLVMARLAQEIHQLGNLAEGRELARAAVAVARELGDPGLSVRALMGLAWTLNHLDHRDERGEVVEEMLECAERSGEAELDLVASEWRCASLLEAGCTEDLDIELARLDELAKLAPVPAQLVRIETLRTARVLLSGDLDGGVELAGETYKMSLAYEPGMADQVFRAQMLVPLREKGLIATVLPLVNEMVAAFPDIPGWRCALAFVLSEAGDRRAAEELISDIFESGLDVIPRDFSWGHSIAMLSEAVANCDRADVAPLLIDELVPFSGLSLPLWFIVGGAAVDHYLGRLTLITGNAEGAVAYLDRAVEFHERAGAVPFLLRSRIELSRAQHLVGVAQVGGTIDLRGTAHQARDAGLESIASLAEAPPSAVAAY